MIYAALAVLSILLAVVTALGAYILVIFIEECIRRIVLDTAPQIRMADGFGAADAKPWEGV